MPSITPVSCSFEPSAPAQSPGQAPSWRVLRADVAERLDHPWLAQIALVTDAVEAPVDALLGQPAVLAWERPGDDIEPHAVRGVVTQAELLGTFDGELHVRVRLEPALALLRHGRRRRIFQDLAAPAIAGELVGPTFTAFHAKLIDRDLVGPPRTREYCVQYDETDLDVLRRVLAEDGVALVFDPLAAHDHVRLVDANAGFATVANERLSCSLDGIREIPVIPTNHLESPDESVQSLTASHSTATARFEESAWDWSARTPTVLRAPASTEGVTGMGEHVQHARARLSELADGHATAEDHTPSLATLCAQRAAVEAMELRGRGVVTLFAPGTTFQTFDHPNDALDGCPYLLTRVTHRIEIPGAAVAGTDRASSYHNDFTCIPLDRPYRPARVAPPHARGCETAIVVGPERQEIHTDRYGRVQVRMHWDERDEPASTCWLRVSQAWAGIGFGTLFLPRVGMEVLVSFLGGNPDRPIVTGCVYDGLHVPPVALPDDRTQSTIRTSSSPGGKGHNELRFEDAAGREEVYLRAQRNLRQQVGNDHIAHVGRDRTRHVDRHETIAVGGDRRITIEGEHARTVTKDEWVHVKRSRFLGVDSSLHQTIGAHVECYVNASTAPEAEPAKRIDGAKLHVGGDCHVEATRSHTLLCGEARVTMDTRSIDIAAPEAITLTVGDTSLHLTPDGLVVRAKSIVLAAHGPVDGGARLTLQADRASLRSPGTATIAGSGALASFDADALLSGTHVRINGTDAVSMGAASLKVVGETVTSFYGASLELLGDLVSIDQGPAGFVLDELRAKVDEALEGLG